jgi:hypothetical protein
VCRNASPTASHALTGESSLRGMSGKSVMELMPWRIPGKIALCSWLEYPPPYRFYV